MSQHSFLLSQQIFLSSALQHCCDIHYFVETFFLWFFSTFVATIFSFGITEFLTVACFCCRCKTRGTKGKKGKNVISVENPEIL